jgi:hypothetical protein
MKNILRLFVGAITASFIALAAQAAELAPAAYSAGAVTGDVTFKVPGASEFQPLASGAALPQGAVIKTGAESRVVIVFGSGSTAAIAPNSEIEITKFEQELFSGAVPVDSEPSVSNTQIRIIEGGVASRVAKLKTGSNYTVNSPVGAAGVRGTTFNVFYSVTTGEFSVATTEGLVVFSSAGGEPTSVPAGQLFIGTVEIMPDGSAVLRRAAIRGLPPGLAEEIERALGALDLVAPGGTGGEDGGLIIAPIDTTQVGVSPS